MPITIVESDAFPTTLTAPVGGEPASAPALVSEFLQGIANRSRWLFNRVNKLVVGGAFTPSDNLSIDTPTAKTIAINGSVADSAANGGDWRFAGAIQARHMVSTPDCSSSGTKAIPYYAEHVYPAGFGSPVASGVILQVGTPPSGDATRRWVMHLVNPNGTALTVKDAAGTTLSTLQNSTGTIRGCTIAFDGSAWEVIDVQFHP